MPAPTACKQMVSGSFSLPCLGYFSPFPHGTGSLSVSQEYLALPDGTGWFTQDFSGPALLRILAIIYHRFRVQGCHLLRLTFPGNSTNNIYYVMQVLQPRHCRNNTGLGYSAFARHYLRNHYCFLLLWVLRCFSSPRSPSESQNPEYPELLRDGLPHSEISGSMLICSLPKLIAACHVLLRL